ncbi:MAG: hypothetical protein ACRD4O_04115 [Bryobacteraceae bacterium]
MRRAQAQQPQARFEVREVNPAELIIFGNPSNSTHMRVGGVEGKVIETRGTKGSPEYLLETKDGKQVWVKPHYHPRTSNTGGGAPNHKPGCDCQICENMKRAGARLPNQQRCDFRLSGGKCGKLASYVSADGKHHHCAEHASASDRSIYDRALPRRKPNIGWETITFKTKDAMEKWKEKHGNNYQFEEVFINNGYALDVRKLRQMNPRVKLTPAQEKAWEFAFRMYIGEGKTDAQADRLAWRDLTLEFPELKKRKNPDGEMTQAVELFQTFHGKDPSGVIEKQVSAAMRLEYTALGDLDYLIVKPEGAGAVRIDFGGDGVKLASAPGGTQLYLIGGKQALDESCLEKFTDDTSKDLFDLGEAHEVQYIAKKAPNFDTVKYYHKFGEESKSSEMPRAFYDALRKQIFLAGGEYHVDAPGIIN